MQITLRCINSTIGWSSFIRLTIIVATIIITSETTIKTNPTSACFWHSCDIFLIINYFNEVGILVRVFEMAPVFDSTILFWSYHTYIQNWFGLFLVRLWQVFESFTISRFPSLRSPDLGRDEDGHFRSSFGPVFPAPINLLQIFSGISHIQISPWKNPIFKCLIFGVFN